MYISFIYFIDLLFTLIFSFTPHNTFMNHITAKPTSAPTAHFTPTLRKYQFTRTRSVFIYAKPHIDPIPSTLLPIAEA